MRSGSWAIDDSNGFPIYRGQEYKKSTQILFDVEPNYIVVTNGLIIGAHDIFADSTILKLRELQ
jgi:hypothetical protein